MKHTLHIKVLAAIAMVMYAVSFVGISVHSCSCTGNVCVSLAMHHHVEHGSCHNDHHDGCSGAHHDDHTDHDAHDCCHSQTYRISISGEDNNGQAHIQAPSSEPVVLLTPYIAPMMFAHHAGNIFIPESPHPRDIIHSVCILRV